MESKSKGIKKHPNRFRSDKFKVKPSKVQLDRPKEKDKNSREIWACEQCFEFVHDTRDAVTEKSKSHVCGTIQSTVKQSKLNALQKLINGFASPAPPPPPPPPPPLPPSPSPFTPRMKAKKISNNLKAVSSVSTEFIGRMNDELKQVLKKRGKRM